jgi:hypothetical protein
MIVILSGRATPEQITEMLQRVERIVRRAFEGD